MKPSSDIPKPTSPVLDEKAFIPATVAEDPHGFSFSNPAIAAEKTD